MDLLKSVVNIDNYAPIHRRATNLCIPVSTIHFFTNNSHIKIKSLVYLLKPCK